MKKMAWITGILTGMMIIFAALGSVLNAVCQIAVDETFYHEQSRAAVKKAMGYTTEEEVSAYIGLTQEQQKEFAWIASRYMLGEDQSIDFPLYVSEDEVRHMIDVRGLIFTARDMSKVYLTLAAALAVVIAWTGARLKNRMRPQLIGALAAVTVMMVLVQNIVNQISAGGFETLFVQMHETLFTNDLWMMNPETDILIRIMPQPLFEQALVNGANMALRMLLVMAVMLFAIDLLVGGMIRRHLNKEK